MSVDGPASKRMRANEDIGTAMIVSQQASTTRSSTLPYPTLKLTGHTGSIYALQYSPSGSVLCSASFDMTCLLWRHGVGDEENDEIVFSYDLDVERATYENYGVLSGHKNAVLDCAWCDNDCIVTCSADKTVMLWDATTATRLRKWDEHTGIINAVTNVSDHLVASASDDGSVLLWDRRQKRPASIYKTDYPILAVAAAASVSESQSYTLFSSGIDPKIHAWDTRRTTTPVYSMMGHTDTVTSLAIHPETTHVLSNSMDQSLRTWDIRPFGGTKRHCQTMTGHRHGAEKGLLKCAWSADGSLVSGGSSDGRVHVWDVISQQELYDLPGHTGCVNVVAFHPTETTVLASGSSDQQIYVGELS